MISGIASPSHARSAYDPLLLLFFASACANGKENVTNVVETTTQLYSKFEWETSTTTTVPPSTVNKLEKELDETQELNVITDQNGSAVNSNESVDEITTDLVEANTENGDFEENMEETKNLAQLEVVDPEETNPRKREFTSNEVTEDLVDNDDFPLVLVKNVTLLEDLVNVTKHRGILHGFSESISVILVSEIGDKTFFIAAILAMRNNKLTVFLAAVSALFLMTVLSALLGWVVTTFIPRYFPRSEGCLMFCTFYVKGDHVLHLYGDHVCVCPEDVVGSLENG